MLHPKYRHRLLGFGAGQDAMHPWSLARSLDADRYDARVRVRTAHERECERVRQPDVIDERCVSQQHAWVFHPAHARPQKLRGGAGRVLHGFFSSTAAIASTILA
jgi:hypothetical protein